MLLYIFFLLFLLLLQPYTVSSQQPNCISLSSSVPCAAFSSFYVDLRGLATEYSFLTNTSTIEEFDEQLIKYVNSTEAYLLPLGCLSSNYNPTIPYARYSLTRLCAAMIQNSDHSLPCNFKYEKSPPPLCKTTCLDWVKSLNEITSNPRVCSDTEQRKSMLLSYEEQCKTWEGFNGTVMENCISGIANEPYTCGFGPDHMKIACDYCKNNPDDGCCQNVENCSHRKLSAGAIVGIVIGSVILMIAMVFLIVYGCRKRKKRLFELMSATNSGISSTTTVPAAVVVEKKIEEFYVAVHAYPAQMPDELDLSAGDIICLAFPFDDGWAIGFNVTTGLKGAFPLVCISPVSTESVDQLLNNNITKIPERSVSCKKSRYDYIEAESPSSPTHQTPFFLK